MPFNFDPSDLEMGYFGDFLEPKGADLLQVNDASDCKHCNLRGCRGCRGETLLLKDYQIDIKREDIEKRFSPLSPLTPDEQRFFDLTGHVPGDAWEGELPNDHIADVGKMVDFDGLLLARSIPWPEVMAGAEQERQWGRKTTLALMHRCHEGWFNWYEHPTTKKWHSYATFPD